MVSEWQVPPYYSCFLPGLGDCSEPKHCRAVTADTNREFTRPALRWRCLQFTKKKKKNNNNNKTTGLQRNVKRQCQEPPQAFHSVVLLFSRHCTDTAATKKHDTSLSPAFSPVTLLPPEGETQSDFAEDGGWHQNRPVKGPHCFIWHAMKEFAGLGLISAPCLMLICECSLPLISACLVQLSDLVESRL